MPAEEYKLTVQQYDSLLYALKRFTYAKRNGDPTLTDDQFYAYAATLLDPSITPNVVTSVGPGLTLDDGTLTLDQSATTGRSVLPVQYVQTAAFPGTYSGGAWTATAAGALSTTIFDGFEPSVGESVEFNSEGVANIGNGLFVRAEDVSGRRTFTRRSDANTGALLTGGVFYTVQAGATQRGTTRQLFTTGTVTLDTTAMLFDQVRERPLIYRDLTKAPYFVKSFATHALAIAEGSTVALANSSAIEQFCEDSATFNVPTAIYPARGQLCGVLPHGNIPMGRPVPTRGNFVLRGHGPGVTVLNFNGAGAGYGIEIGIPRFPPLGAVPGSGDTGATTFPLRTNDATTNPINQYWDLSEAAGWDIDWSTPVGTFECRVNVVNNSLDPDNNHLISYRGARRFGDPVTVMHALYGVSGQIKATLRTVDPMNLKQVTGVNAASVVLSGTAIDATTPLDIEILSATTFRYSFNLKATWVGNPANASTIHTFVPATPLALLELGEGASVTFPAGTYGLGATAASFVQPAAVGTVQIQIPSTTGLAPGKPLNIGGGSYNVMTVDSGTLVTVVRTTVPGPYITGETVPSGTLVNDQTFSTAQTTTLFATTNTSLGFLSANYTQPAVGSTVQIQIPSTTGLGVGQLFCVGVNPYTLVSVDSGTLLTVRNRGTDAGHPTVAAPGVLITTANRVSDASMYEIAHQYDGTTTTLAINRRSTAAPVRTAIADPSPVSVAQTGKVVSFTPERCVLGAAWNESFSMAGLQTAALDVHFGGLSFNDTLEGPAAAIPGNIGLHRGGRLWWTPTDPTVRTDVSYIGKDGLLKYWQAQTRIGGLTGARIRPSVGLLNDFYNYTRLLDLTIDTGAAVSTALSCLTMADWWAFKNITLAGAGNGIYMRGFNFFGDISDITINVNGYGYRSAGGDNRISNMLVNNATIPFHIANGSGHINTLRIDANGVPDCYVILDNSQCVTFDYIQFSDESTSGLRGNSPIPGGAAFLISVQDDCIVTVDHGLIGFLGHKTAALSLGGGTSASSGRVRYGVVDRLRPDAPFDCIISDAALGNRVMPTELTAEHSRRCLALAEHPEYFLGIRDMPIDNPIALTNAAATISRGDGPWFRLAAATLSVARVLTLSPLRVRKGQTLRLTVLAQGFNYTVNNGGRAGGTLETVTAGAVLFREYYFDGANWEIYR